VLTGILPEQLQHAAEMYAGCISGAIQKDEYLRLINENGFKDVLIQKEKQIIIPDDILGGYLSPEEIAGFKNSGMGIYSITVFAKKPEACCAPGCCN
jgi:hypothetical protein